MLKAFEEKDGATLLGDTGLVEDDILQVVPKFSCWCETHPEANILDFFRHRHIPGKVIRALALLGFKAVVDELNKQTKSKDNKATGKKK